MIVVAGENLVDLVLDSRGKVAARPGGGPYNTARAVSRLGERCSYLGAIGTDGFGRLIRTKLELDGVDLSLVNECAEPSTLAVAEVDAHGAAEYHFYHHATASPLVDTSLLDSFPTPKALHVGTLGLVWQPMCDQLVALVKSLPSSVVLMVDPNCRPAAVDDRESYVERVIAMMARADIVKVSTDDLAYLAPNVPPEAAARWLIQAGAAVVLVTAGGSSISVVTENETRTTLPPPVDVVDSIGAGDAFGGAFLAYWVRQGWAAGALPAMDDLVRAAEFGCLVGSMTCQVVGAEPPSASALPSF